LIRFIFIGEIIIGILFITIITILAFGIHHGIIGIRIGIIIGMDITGHIITGGIIIVDFMIIIIHIGIIRHIMDIIMTIFIMGQEIHNQPILLDK
jgi:hypothetical protein